VSLYAPRATGECMRSGRASVSHLRRARLRGLLEIGFAVCCRIAAHLGGQPGAIKQEVATPIASGVFEYSIRRIRILKKWKNSIRIRIGKLEFDSREL
jgi:hypothetical protein